MMNQYKPYITSALKLLIKEIVWSIGCRYAPSHALKPICLHASRRSGSTLAMEMVCANKGIRFSDQPFGFYTMSGPNINKMPVFEYGQIINLDEDELAIFKEFFSGLLDGTVHANLPWKFWDSGYDFRPNRMFLKITDAKSIADIIDDEFDVETIVMTRHPIPQSLSVMRNGWLVTGKAFLRSEKYVSTYLDGKLHDYGMGIYRTGSKLQRHVLDWILENIPLIQFLKNRPEWGYFSYEGLVMYPEDTIKMLSRKCALNDYEKMLSVVKRPSRSSKNNSTASTRKCIDEGNNLGLVEQWKKKVSEDEIKECFNLLEMYGVELYRSDSVLPNLDCIGR